MSQKFIDEDIENKKQQNIEIIEYLIHYDPDI